MKNQISTLIIDDEAKSIASLKLLLTANCPQVTVVGDAKTVKEAIEKIEIFKPDLIFLDIAMPDGDGFDVLEKVSYHDFEVIFVTAYNQYALKAFDFSAIHYILKPVNPSELQKAVNRFEKRANNEGFNKRIEILKETLNNKPEKIILPSSDGLEIINLDEIIRCEADSNYTLFFLSNGKKIIVSKSLNNFEKMLSDVYFCRVHSKYLINLRYVKHYTKGKGGQIIMQDGSTVYVSESRKNYFINSLKNFARSI